MGKKVPSLSPAMADMMIARALERVDRSITAYGGRFPAPSSQGGVYPLMDNEEWTNGFWPGMLWLAWELSGEERYRAAADALMPGFADRVARRHLTDHHDLGFLYTLSTCAAWQLTGNEEARLSGLMAAELLLSRYNSVARVIQAWGDLSDPEQSGRMIIDCNLNLPLLWWAARETGDRRFAQAADAHVEQAAKLLVRPDHSTYHTYYVDTRTGLPRHGSTHQGFSDDSCWARGQAWGIYGFALAFRHTGRRDYLDLAAQLADYYLARLPDDGICCWDLIFTKDEPRDSSAAAITICGLLELASALPIVDTRRALYQAEALRMAESLDRDYLAPLEGSDGMLAHAVYHWPNKVGVDECCIWGDYFYLEALMRLRRAWQPYWA
ncbi:glycoside hydrolase family 88 protein [Novosphingobium sp.]|uniref:glycoside hydrolase family 88 protein n=1 Tax=Novosphingobium sp. TaxID=1874826 RepID=UPI0031D40F3E